MYKNDLTATLWLQVIKERDFQQPFDTSHMFFLSEFNPQEHVHHHEHLHHNYVSFFSRSVSGKLVVIILQLKSSIPNSRHWGFAASFTHLKIHILSRSLQSISDRHLMVPSQKGMKSLSQTFMFSVSYWWNGLPNPTRTAESLTMLKKQLNSLLPSRDWCL